ncbi:hypothetical protein DFJ77DRAFT_70170 [Powellomyces hirtus]|nr:hypothetical protein DFJ77DRAFT_70170 [Powellomyces hirtus]
MAAEISREEHKLLEAGHHDPKISDLATASARKDKITRLPAIPLTIFAPLLVIVSLICVLLPTFILLSEGSSTSTNTLSDNYLTTLMDKVSGNITNSVKVMFPVIEYLTSMPRVAATFATPNLTNMQTAPWGADLTRLHHKYGLDTIGCMQVFWKPGFSNATASVSPPSNATVQFNQLTTYNSPGAGAVIVKTDSNETNALAKVYGIHPTSIASYRM